MEQTKEIVSIEGSVENIIFKNEDSGFTVMELGYQGDLLTVVGELYGVAEGEEVKLSGYFTSHPQYGHQFKALTCERNLPATANAILKYLSSGALKGVGPVTARRLVERFGDDTLTVIENEPERLLEVRGITERRANQIREEFNKIFGVRAVMSFMAQFQILPIYSIRVWRTFGSAAIEIIQDNPFLLCSNGIDLNFSKADEIRERLGMSEVSPHRLFAGVVYVLRRNTFNGHTCLPLDRLAQTAKELLGVDLALVEEIIGQNISEENLILVTVDGRDFIYLPQMYRAETFIAERISMVQSFFPDNGQNWDKRIDALEKSTGKTYAKNQRRAIATSLSQGLMVLTGGPGTGKTTTINAMIELFKEEGNKVVLTAPTGRAAKRMSEITGCEAKTIHRLLEVEYTTSGEVRFARDERHPIDAEVIIVDELSMVDVTLFESLLRAMKLTCRLILVGDANQLPPVGAGCVLKDLIDSECVTVVELNEIFRQAAQSLIVTNAHAIVSGETPDLRKRDNDFFFLPCQNQMMTAATVVDLCNRRLPKSYGYSPVRDIQVLCPTRIGEIGTEQLNRELQQVLNPKSPQKTEAVFEAKVFREQDKVMQVKNNYDIPYKTDQGEQGAGIFNGDIGFIEEIDRPSSTIWIRFDDRVAEYSFDQLDEIELAYAVTVHKSQGSEFEAVIIPLFGNHKKLYYRNLLYTAVTRAKKLLILVGQQQSVAQMVANNRKTLRYTNLAYFLRKCNGILEE